MSLFDPHKKLEKLSLFVDSARSGEENMAIDEALVSSGCGPALRFYRWLQPTISLGYFLRFTDAANRHGSNFDYVRRWTGGGTVEHGAKETWTYSLVLPSSCGLAKIRARLLYGEVHRALSRVLINDETFDEAGSEEGKSNPAGACFANPVAGDLLREGQKIAGAAMRRSRSGILLQGSVRGVRREDTVPERFAGTLAKVVVSFDPFSDVSKFESAVDGLRRTRYGTRHWLESR